MRKRISLKTRRPDLSRQAFRNHYEECHVPLGLEFIDRFEWRRYVRNYVLEVQGSPVGFDCYTEFWVDDAADDEALRRFIDSPEFQVLNEDDQRFLDIGCRFSLEMRETLVVRSSSHTGELPKKVAVLWKGTSTGLESRGEARSIADRIVSSLEGRVVDAMLDTAIGATPFEAPFDTLLTLRLAHTGGVDLEAAVLPKSDWSVLVVEPVETPAALLFGGGRSSPG